MWQEKGQLVLNTAGRIPAGWDVSEKVSSAAVVHGLGRSDGSSLCNVHHPTRVGGLISRLIFLFRATTSLFLPTSWMKIIAPQ